MIAIFDKKPHPSEVIRLFREPKEGSVYSGSYKLTGDNLESIKVNFQSVPDARFREFRGIATGSCLKFAGRLETYNDIPQPIRTYEGDLNFHTE